MENIKFDFIYEGKTEGGDNGKSGFNHKVYTLEQLLEKPLNELSDVHSQCKLIAKRLFTGLQDKDRKDLYAGDTFEWWNPSMSAFENGVVYYEPGCFMVETSLGKRYWLNDVNARIKITGNIHQPLNKDGVHPSDAYFISTTEL